MTRISWVRTYGQTELMWYPYPNFGTGSELLHDVMAEAQNIARPARLPATANDDQLQNHQTTIVVNVTVTMASGGTDRPAWDERLHRQ